MQSSWVQALENLKSLTAAVNHSELNFSNSRSNLAILCKNCLKKHLLIGFI